MSPLFKSDVRSGLARRERAGRAGEGRCESRYRLSAQWRAMLPQYGAVVQCERPATAHRVHQAGSVQWERSNVK